MDRLEYVRNYVNELSVKIDRSVDDISENGLLCTDFIYNIKISFEDGSYCYFLNSIYIDDDSEYCIIFTEHNGYIKFYSSSVLYVLEERLKEK